MADDTPISRRPILAGLGALGLGAVIGTPVLASFLGQAGPDGAVDVALGAIDLFPSGSIRRVVVTADHRDGWLVRRAESIGTVWVVRGADASFRVLATVCPHLGCSTVEHEGAFHCPCHNSRFQVDGSRSQSGPNPSPRDMDPLEHQVVDGVLRCKFQRFRSGIADRVAEAG